MKLAIPLITVSVLAAGVAAAVWFPSSVVLTTGLLPAAGEPIPSAAPVVAKSSQRESGLKIDYELTSVAAAFKNGQIFLDDKAKQAIDRVIPAAQVASMVRVHGIEPTRAGNAVAAKRTAVARAFAARVYMAEHDVDPKIVRLNYHTKGSNLVSSVAIEVLNAGEIPASRGIVSVPSIELAAKKIGSQQIASNLGWPHATSMDLLPIMAMPTLTAMIKASVDASALRGTDHKDRLALASGRVDRS